MIQEDEKYSQNRTPAAWPEDVVARRFFKSRTDIPLFRPNPPRLSEHAEALREIELSGTYSNYGPVNARLEQSLVQRIFGRGHCLTTCNATLALMIAIREVSGDERGERQFALMPSFTFAATAQAALWCGLTPLLCDIDPHTWLPCAVHEEELLERHRGRIAVVVPYATFGNNLDLCRYEALSARFDVPVVVDAAASLGSLNAESRAFGTGFRWPVVFSMHATKPFSVGEGGIIYSEDGARLERLRTAGSFGFGTPRSATMAGLNSKLTEVAALTALLQLEGFSEAAEQRDAVADQYKTELLDEPVVLQQQCGARQIRAFQPIALPPSLAPFRDSVLKGLQERGIGCGKYFSPHLAQQPLFQQMAHGGELPVTDDLASRMISLPLLPGMQPGEVSHVVQALQDTIADLPASSAWPN